ncbi:MAG: hypothetical protein IJN79_03565, partial [Clostridia bacterium]|nr:hypothetical protein [Clostridia bacterium]
MGAIQRTENGSRPPWYRIPSFTGGFLFGSALPGSSIDSVMVNAHRWRFSGSGALWAQFSGRKTVRGRLGIASLPLRVVFYLVL